MAVYGKATLWVILASATLPLMCGAVIAPVLNPMTEGLGVNPGAARVLITTHALFIALFGPLFGVIVDRIGPKKPIALGLALYGMSGGAGLFINDYWPLLVTRALLGIGATAIFVPITVLVFNLYKQGERRNKVMGWRASSHNVGGIIWPILGGFLGTFSWHLPFATYLIGLPLALLVLLFIPETQAESPTTTADKEKTVLRLLRENPTIFVIYWLFFLNMVFLAALFVFLPEILKQLGMTSSFHIGLFISAISLAGGITALMYGRIRAKLSHRTIVAIVLALWVVGFITLSQASTSLLVGLSTALFGVGQGMLIPTATLWVGELVPASFRGRITSYQITFGLVGQFLSPIILNPLASSLGLSAVFLMIGVTCALLLALFLMLIRR